MRYQRRDTVLTIRCREDARESWREAADVAGFDGLSSWARQVLNLAARHTLEGALERVPASELELTE